MAEARGRIAWIDSARGIGILLVVLGHSSLPRSVRDYIYTFHMPLFFLLSGYLLVPGRWHSVGAFIRRRVRTLLVPYAAFYLVLYIYYLLVGSRFGDVVSEDLTTPLVGFLISSSDYLEDIFRPMWFLPCLFAVDVMFFSMYRLCGQWYVLGLLFSAALGYLSSLYLESRPPWSLDTALTALFFYGAGFLLRTVTGTARPAALPVRLLGLGLCAGVSLLVARLNGGVSLLANHYGDWALFYIGAFAGIFACLLIAQLLGNSHVLGYIGRNSLIIFVFHSVAMGLLKGFLTVGIGVPRDTFQRSLVWGLFLTIASVAMLWPLILVVNRYFPYVLGRPRIASRSPDATRAP